MSRKNIYRIGVILLIIVVLFSIFELKHDYEYKKDKPYDYEENYGLSNSVFYKLLRDVYGHNNIYLVDHISEIDKSKPEETIILKFGDDFTYLEDSLYQFISEGAQMLVCTKYMFFEFDSLSVETEPNSDYSTKRIYSQDANLKSFKFKDTIFNSSFAPINIYPWVEEDYNDESDSTSQTMESLKRDSFANDSETEVLDKTNGSVQTLNHLYTLLWVNDLKPLAAEFKINKGKIVTHSMPVLFANISSGKEYFLPHMKYVMSRFSGKKIYLVFDFTMIQARKSRFAEIYANKHFRSSMYTIFFGCIMFLLFNLKRRLNYIPLIIPTENKVVGYVRTLAHLYEQQSQPHSIVRQMQQNFFLYVQTVYGIIPYDENYEQKLQQKSKIEDTLIHSIMVDFVELQQRDAKDYQLQSLYQKIKKFKSYKP